jgi:Helix-turn-helix domain
MLCSSRFNAFAGLARCQIFKISSGLARRPLSLDRVKSEELRCRRMSWQAVTWVLEFSDSEGYSRLTLISIASHANREGKSAFPSLETIAREARLSHREAIYCVQKLEEMGELRVERGIGRGNPNHYELPHVSRWLEKVHNVHQLEEEKGGPKKIKGAQNRVKGALKAIQGPANGISELQTQKVHGAGEPLKVKDRTVKSSDFQSISFPERSKPKSLEEQKAELRQKGFLQ